MEKTGFGVRMNLPHKRPSTAYAGGTGDYYGGFDRPYPGRRDTNGYFNGRFQTAEDARQERERLNKLWVDGQSLIASSIVKVANGQAYSERNSLNNNQNNWNNQGN